MVFGRLATFAALAAVFALAAACGGDDEPVPSPSATPTAVVTGPGTDLSENLAVGDDFLAALATNTAESLSRAETLVQPKSAAARYVSTAQAALSDGAVGPRALSPDGIGRYRLCAGADCTVLRDIVLVDGLVSSFKVDGKQLR